MNDIIISGTSSAKWRGLAIDVLLLPFLIIPWVSVHRRQRGEWHRLATGDRDDGYTHAILRIFHRHYTLHFSTSSAKRRKQEL